MTTPSWNSLLPGHQSMKTMSADELGAVEQASGDYLAVLANGISGIGHMLACTASNSETGISSSAVTDIGWMLESLGVLISNLSDTRNSADFLLTEVKVGE
ncbi:MAG TPA: hypothetical protein DIW67_16360 [Pseudomonas sp.]|nr:hypothetical protein [Pseudomonas sp.]